MKIPLSVRRIAISGIVATGLAYPACAAVCPKGHGNCTSPGKCFLYVDADANSICDYTGRTGTQSSGSYPSRPGAPADTQTAVQTVTPSSADTTIQTVTTSSPDPAALQVTATPAQASQTAQVTTVPVQATDTTATVIQNTSSGGFFDTIHLSAPLMGILLFLVLTGTLFILVRYGMAGIRIERTRPALAFSMLASLCLSLMTICILAVGTIAGTDCALIYMVAGTLLAAYLWQSGIMTRRIVTITALLSTLAGFVFLAPIMPLELGGIVNVLTGVSALTTGVIVICALILLALVTGRAFCGNICPVGSLQELAFDVPVRKITVKKRRYWNWSALPSSS